ncbi:MAG: pantoate--beta-alanine ligase [Deltaproteobacteria bacterium]|nr:pantoate--beta-alanine ligase [Deltaproteobacteria bacterium]
MLILDSVAAMQQWSQARRQAGQDIAFVPTMGFLHQGHVSLLDAARKAADLLVLSIFVNPTQFGAGEDFDTYPQDLAKDTHLAKKAGVDVVFVPPAAQMYPQGYNSWVEVAGITEVLCGASRPGHFRGVTTVVNKLFNIIAPRVAFFGNKDFQQLAVIRRMVKDLNLPVDIVGLPIVREADGLAMSSRNSYLAQEERQQALCLSQAIAQAQQLAKNGELRVTEILHRLRMSIESHLLVKIDYLKICHQDSLQEQMLVDENSVLLLAVFIGRTRLIDNAFVLEPVAKIPL